MIKSDHCIGNSMNKFKYSIINLFIYINKYLTKNCINIIGEKLNE